MDKQTLESALRDASGIVAPLPQHLQEKAFELAVNFMLGGTTAEAKVMHKTPHVQRAQVNHHTDERPAVSDLLKVCKNNADKYVVFMHDLEDKGEAATSKSLLDEFNDYRQFKPGNIPRDLRNLSGDDWAKPTSKDRSAPYELRDKGRKRYAQLVAALNDEQ